MRVVILDPPTKGHVTQRMRNPKIASLRCTAKRLSYDIAAISETTTPINKKFQQTNNENVSGDAVLWRHNKSKMADGRHFEDR